jgi:predicted nuclease of predicted toxin-antitoxin system
VKFKLDENLPVAARSLLNEQGQDALSVHDEHLVGRSDEVVSDIARTEGRMLVTFDLDFADERAYPPGSHAGIMVLRLRSQHSSAVVRVLEQIVSSQDVEAFAGALVIVTDATVRVRRA